MTTKELIQHPTTGTLSHGSLFLLFGVMLRDHAALQANLSTLQAFISSPQTHVAVAALVAIFNTVRTGMKPTAAVQPPQKVVAIG